MAPVDSSEVSVLLTHTNRLVMLDDAEVNETHIQLAVRFRLLSWGLPFLYHGVRMAGPYREGGALPLSCCCLLGRKLYQARKDAPPV